jgi:ankyrin repeat protein
MLNDRARRLLKRPDIVVKAALSITLAVAWLAGCATVPPPPMLAIWDAAELGRIEVVRQHMAAGTDVNVRGGIAGLTALHQAAFNGHTAIAIALIEAGADVNATSFQGETPLHLTVYWEHREIAGLLLANGAKMNAKARDGRTPLDWAVHLGASEMVRLFRSSELDSRVNAE